MPTPITNPVLGMLEHRGSTVNQFGLDTTGVVEYQFNRQGFRGHRDFDFAPEYAFFGCSLVFGIGVHEQNTFASMFPQSHNYGLAGLYHNSDVFDTVSKFINSEFYYPGVKLVTVWHSRNDEQLDSYYQQLANVDMLHFFCGTPLVHNRCYMMVPKQDFDVSQTHMGVNTHRIMYKIICNLLSQL
jgi:hypothetical protein